jgi:hypothetical protein
LKVLPWGLTLATAPSLPDLDWSPPSSRFACPSWLLGYLATLRPLVVEYPLFLVEGKCHFFHAIPSNTPSVFTIYYTIKWNIILHLIFGYNPIRPIPIPLSGIFLSNLTII